MHIFKILGGITHALIGHGWKNISIALFLALLGVSTYSLSIKNKLNPRESQFKVIELAKGNVQSGTEVLHTVEVAKKSRERLSHVLQTNKPWSKQRVPDDVVTGLCAKVRCSESSD